MTADGTLFKGEMSMTHLELRLKKKGGAMAAVLRVVGGGRANVGGGRGVKKDVIPSLFFDQIVCLSFEIGKECIVEPSTAMVPPFTNLRERAHIVCFRGVCEIPFRKQGRG